MAGMPPQYMTTGGSDAPCKWYASLPDHVRRLYEYRGDYSNQPLAIVVLAEVVCEAFTVWALKTLFKNRNENWEKFTGAYGRQIPNIFNKKIQLTYKLLSGDEIEKTSFWPALAKHNKRRNNLVHEGIIPSQSEADESFKAVEDFMQHVIKKVKPESPL